MRLRHRYRIYPTPAQANSLARAFGCCRVVFNDVIALRDAALAEGRPWVSDAEVSRVVVTEAKRRPERAWLADASAVALQQAVRDANRAYKHYFDSRSGRRRGGPVGKPRFKSRRDRRQAVRFTRNARFKITPDGRLHLPSIGEMAVTWSRDLPGEPSSVTVIRDAAGRYFASFVCEVAVRPTPDNGKAVGLDLGLDSFVADSDGAKVEAPRLLRAAARRLERAHRALARKRPGSANREKARSAVAALHAAVADRRADFLHKLSSRIISENQVVVIEDLCVKGLARTRLAKSVHDAAWNRFTRMLEYKAALYGREVVKIDRFLPSTRTCSSCWVVGAPKPLQVRSWTCQHCGVLHDRDVNAAKVILAAGLAERKNACGAVEDLVAHPRAQASA
ncbi:RNA-guided endonuclease InsQ/TnpB family protein [Glycomyces algeriensis]|uniref:Transposase n=1 Tax=Glycomyces algeriensis TaxID=256037 RepID=A0A9W6LFK3_9ACTN|nr:RNA-guided endonuclease TnpB family protein [Glycomyces algeriensis]MDA1366222.1 RNA-guided endonuclease TnpB family protein [Glycomyces algeriensis]MDR7349010.1 putative transposase [Glycomyces algeriensis]GLI41713.1 transposase [Glycomyces algeriensis]